MYRTPLQQDAMRTILKSIHAHKHEASNAWYLCVHCARVRRMIFMFTITSAAALSMCACCAVYSLVSLAETLRTLDEIWLLQRTRERATFVRSLASNKLRLANRFSVTCSFCIGLQKIPSARAHKHHRHALTHTRTYRDEKGVRRSGFFFVLVRPYSACEEDLN